MTVGMCVGVLFFKVYLPFATVIPASSMQVLMTALLALLVLDCLMAWSVARLLSFEPSLGFEAVILLGMLSLMFSGVTWPTDMFPAPFRLISYVNPFTPFAKGLRSMIPLDVGTDKLSVMYGAFLAEAALFLGIGVLGALIGRLIRRISGGSA